MQQTISLSKIKKSCEDVCQILKALSHPQRLLILSHLLQGPKTVSDLVDLCEISQSQMSQFLTRLKFEGIIESQKSGQFNIYRIADKRLVHLVKTIQREYCE